MARIQTRSIAATRDALLDLPHPFQRDQVHRVVSALSPGSDELAPYMNFSDRAYTRTRFYQGDRFQILVLCWKNGQASPIHDHARSICSMAVVRGSCLATNYAAADGSDPGDCTRVGTIPIVATGSEVYVEGQVATVEAADIHRITTRSGGGDLVTVHFYLPSIDTMRCWDEASGRCQIIEPETLMPKTTRSAASSG